MKTTGTTEEGNKIVEMSLREWRALGLLANVIEGKELNFFTDWEPGLEYDLSTALGAIIHFTTHKELINRLRNHLDKMEQMIGSDKQSEGDRMMEFFKE